MKAGMPGYDQKLEDEINSFLFEQEAPAPDLGSEEEEKFAAELAKDIYAPEEEEEDKHLEPEKRGWAIGRTGHDEKILKEDNEKWEDQIEEAMMYRMQAVLLVGESGVGKTTMLNNMAAEYLDAEETVETDPATGEKTKRVWPPVAYFNSPTMDPFLHLVGLPHIHRTSEQTENYVLSFIRKSGTDHAELLILDEINRVRSDQQNALFELVATRQINGEKLGRLEMVWGAMNPPKEGEEGRNVTQVEDAMAGRFDAVIWVKAAPKMRHYVDKRILAGEDPKTIEGGPRTHITERVAMKCLRWWYEFVEKGKSKSGKAYADIITPRVLEYIMRRVQDLEDRRLGKREVDGKPIVGRTGKPLKAEWLAKRQINPAQWDVLFEPLTQHKMLHSKAEDATIPFDELKRSMYGKELYEVGSLMNGSPFLPERMKEVEEEPELQFAATTVILRAITPQRLIGKAAAIPWEDIGQFSEFLCFIDRNAAMKILNHPFLAGYLHAKASDDDRVKQIWAGRNPKRLEQIMKPMSNDERKLYLRLKTEIDEKVKEAWSRHPSGTPLGPKPGGARPGGGGAPAVPAPKRRP